jgi:hypothetical protein
MAVSCGDVDAEVTLVIDGSRELPGPSVTER